ncbi:MAG: lysostaphin resistance A-like protein [Brachybacterium sp.]|nr:lysostaphin resistance A-like protein [Brachybacterium sp.]
MDTTTTPHRSENHPHAPGADSAPDQRSPRHGNRLAVPTAPRPRLPAWARAVLTGLLLLPAASAGIVLLVIPGFEGLLNRQDGIGIAAIAAFWTTALIAYLVISWLLMRLIDRRGFAALGLRIDGRAGVALLAGMGIALLAGLLTVLITEGLGVARPAGDVGMDAAPLWMILAIVVLRSFVLQGIGEEVLFRGYLMQSLASRPHVAVWVAAVAFTIPHLLSSGGQQSAVEHLIYLMIPFGFAISAGYLAMALGSVWAAVGIHGGFHVAVFVLGAAGFTSDGPWVWATIGMLHLLAGLGVARLIPAARWAEIRERGVYARG